MTSSDDTPLSSQPTQPSGGPSITFVAVLVAVGGVLLLAIAGFYVVNDDDSTSAETASATGAMSNPEDWSGVLLEEPRPRPDFTLTDTDGQEFNFREETEGELTLLFFGYTNCPDICPIQLATLAGALEEGGVPNAKVVFVGVDTERDTPEAVRSFLDRHNEDFIGLTGTPEDIAAAEEAAGVAQAQRISDEPGEPIDFDAEDYLVGHSSEVVAFTPDDQAHITYPTGTRRQDWTNDLPRLIEEFPAAAETLSVSDAWMSESGDIAAGYVTIENSGEADVIVGVTSPAAETISVMAGDGSTGGHTGDGMTSYDVPSGTTVLEPEVDHIMFEDLVEPLSPGDTVEFELELEQAGPIPVEAEVLDWDEVVDRLDR
jgi:protein SCO1/2